MIVYKITNMVNRKVYIGQTIKSLGSRWSKHKSNLKAPTAINSAIHKYGAENFTIEQIDVALTRDELDEKEIYWISFYSSTDKEIGYNIKAGGKHNFISSTTGEKISKAKMGKKHSEETKRKISASKKGSKMSQEACDAQSIRLKGRVFSEEHKRKLSEASKGKPKSDSHRQKISECQIGKKLSQESINKMMKTRRERYGEKTIPEHQIDSIKKSSTKRKKNG